MTNDDDDEEEDDEKLGKLAKLFTFESTRVHKHIENPTLNAFIMSLKFIFPWTSLPEFQAL